jgi:hypothetical protein
MRWRFALSVCASFVAGALVTWSLQRNVESDRPQDTRLNPPDAARVVTVREPARSCDEAIAECEHARDFYRAQLVVYEGVPQTWPSDVPSAFTEAPLREALANASEGVAIVEQLDCVEYPCIALVGLTSDDQSCCAQFEERLPDPVRQKTGGARIFQTADGRMNAALAFGARERWNDDATTMKHGSEKRKWRARRNAGFGSRAAHFPRTMTHGACERRRIRAVSRTHDPWFNETPPRRPTSTRTHAPTVGTPPARPAPASSSRSRRARRRRRGTGPCWCRRRSPSRPSSRDRRAASSARGMRARS